jgi:PAS domain S-box-containing protein
MSIAEIAAADSLAPLLPSSALSLQAHRDALGGLASAYQSGSSDGTVHVQVEPLRDAGGTIRGTIGIALDVAEGRRTEEELRAGEERFRSLSACSPVGIFIADVDGRGIYANPRYQAITGLSLAEVQGYAWSKILHPEDRDAVVVEWLRIVRSGGEYSRRCRFLLANGEVRWIHTRAARMLSAEGQTMGFVGTVEDITERTLAEEELRRSEERYRLLVDALDEGVVLKDAQGVISKCNAAAERILGVTKDDLLGKTRGDQPLYIREDSSPIAWEDFPSMQTLRTGKPLSDVVMGLPDTQGGVKWISVSTRPLIRPGEGAPHGVVVSFSDITARMQAEKERTALAATVQVVIQEWVSTFDAIGFPIVLLDGGRKVARLNRAARDLAGRETYREILGRPLDALGTGEPWRSATELAKKLDEPAASVSCQAREAGIERHWEIFASRAGLQDHIVVMIRNVTRRVELEHSLRRAEAIAALGTLLAAVAHEMRNSLFAISSTVEAISARFGSMEEMTPFLSSLRGGVNRMGRLVRDLLEYGKPMRLEMRACPIAQIVAETVASVAPLALDSGVELVQDVQPGLPLLIADPDRLLQVFQNLVENAIQHSYAGGPVEIAVRDLKDNGERRIVCTVRDFGPGFRKEDLPNVFEPFFTRRRGGTGIGLPLARKIVDHHSGTIQVTNHADGGALVTVILPVTQHSAREGTSSG